MTQNLNVGFGDDKLAAPQVDFPISEQVPDVTISKCEYESRDNWDAINVTYTTPEGAYLTDRMFVPEYDKCTPYPGSKRTQKEEFNLRTKVFNTQLLSIAEAIGVSRDVLQSVDTSTISGFCTDYCNLITSALPGNKVWLKTSRNNKNYTTVSRSSNSTRAFIQPMEEGVECKLQYSSAEAKKLDKVMMSVPAGGVSNGSYDDDEDWGDKL